MKKEKRVWNRPFSFLPLSLLQPSPAPLRPLLPCTDLAAAFLTPTPCAPAPSSAPLALAPGLALHSPLCAPDPAIIPLHAQAIIDNHTPLRPLRTRDLALPYPLPRLRPCCCTKPAPPALCAPVHASALLLATAI
ncbi:hypothetical protein SLEP1_g2526 [Rubroshorea leprosula]|uniref:Uncharacterized protein n=1 Tax=Rubroshorea leprosula TaxID=152421 RepID=A0AAV5HTA7_9ROSI|nr:hypothetical protein SLEP1_g2526 [Rubroshorea leprosula]